MTDQPYGRRTGPRDRRLRVGNEERDAVAEILRREHLAGRLDDVEFDERLTRCLSAKTYAELDALLTDLPVVETDRRQWRGFARQRWPLPLLVLPFIAAVIVFSHGRAAWLLIPFVFFFVVRPFVWSCRPYASRRI
jgi:hypothetical protein